MTWTPIYNFGTSGAGGSSSSRAGAPGQRGQDGSTWLSGKSKPALSQGKVGDFFLVLPGGDVYQKQFAIPLAPPQWVFLGNLATGKQGPQGIPGVGSPGRDGAPGTAGRDGTAGSAGSAGTNGQDGVPGVAPAGPRGQDGATWLMGQAPPVGTLGKTGDFYFQSAPLSPGPVLIAGPQGIPGIAGSPGQPGASIKSDGGQFTPSSLSVWTLTNAQAGATLTAADKSIVLFGPTNAADNFSMALKAVPATPYSCLFYLSTVIAGANFCQAGVLWRASGSNFVKTLSNVWNTNNLQIEVGKGVDGTNHTQTEYVVQNSQVRYSWFKLADDGVNQTYWISTDGITWAQVYTQASNTDVTPNQVGFFVNPRNASGFSCHAALWSYQETK